MQKEQTVVSSVEEQLLERDVILDDLKGQLIQAQQKMKKLADRHRKDVSFDEGEWVFLKLQPYRQRSMAHRPFQKLAARCYGPYLIIKKIGSVAYPVTWVSQDSPSVPRFATKESHWRSRGKAHLTRSSIGRELILNWEPEAVLEVRNQEEEDGLRMEVLIKWKDMPEFESTWEDFMTIQQNISGIWSWGQGQSLGKE